MQYRETTDKLIQSESDSKASLKIGKKYNEIQHEIVNEVFRKKSSEWIERLKLTREEKINNTRK